MTKVVRAKFKVQSTATTESGTFATLVPVISGSKENEEFFKYTPSGEIKIGTINPEAAKQFVPGKLFYVDFTEAV
jgi:hypothetical protein